MWFSKLCSTRSYIWKVFNELFYHIVLPHRKYCGTEVDTWSCGVILFALLAGFLPFDEEVIPALFKKIKDADYQMPNQLSPDVQDLIRNMLKANPLERIRFDQIQMHPWLKESSAIYYQLHPFGNKIGPLKINEDIYTAVRDMDFNYHNFPENKIRESIIKKKDYSFVIAYDLIMDDTNKKEMIIKMSIFIFLVILSIYPKGEPLIHPRLLHWEGSNNPLIP